MRYRTELTLLWGLVARLTPPPPPPCKRTTVLLKQGSPRSVLEGCESEGQELTSPSVFKVSVETRDEMLKKSSAQDLRKEFSRTRCHAYGIKDTEEVILSEMFRLVQVETDFVQEVIFATSM